MNDEPKGYFQEFLEMMEEVMSAEPIEATTVGEDIISTVFFQKTNIYETAIKVKEFNSGEWIIVSRTKSEDKGLTAHYNWVKRIEQKEDLDSIFDVYTLTCYLRDKK